MLFGGGVSAIISLLFATRGGINFLDVADEFINSFGVALAGLVEVVVVIWILKQATNLQTHANQISDIQLGSWWKICLGVITPIILGYMMIDKLRAEPYGGGSYSGEFLLYSGWLVAAGALIVGILFSFISWKKDTIELPADKEVSR